MPWAALTHEQTSTNSGMHMAIVCTHDVGGTANNPGHVERIQHSKTSTLENPPALIGWSGLVAAMSVLCDWCCPITPTLGDAMSTGPSAGDCSIQCCSTVHSALHSASGNALPSPALIHATWRNATLQDNTQVHIHQVHMTWLHTAGNVADVTALACAMVGAQPHVPCCCSILMHSDTYSAVGNTAASARSTVLVREPVGCQPRRTRTRLPLLSTSVQRSTTGS